MLTRRSTLIGALFAPAIIRLPNLLMPTSPKTAPRYNVLTLFDTTGGTWRVPIFDDTAALEAFRPLTIRDAAQVQTPDGQVLADVTLTGRPEYRIWTGDSLHIDGLRPTLDWS